MPQRVTKPRVTPEQLRMLDTILSLTCALNTVGAGDKANNMLKSTQAQMAECGRKRGLNVWNS